MMLSHPALDQIRALELDGMAQAFIELEFQEEARDLAHAEWLALLLRFQTRLRAIRHSQSMIKDIYNRTPRRLDESLFQQLATTRRISEPATCWSAVPVQPASGG
ncbi:ATP-binding protein [Bradyrhizobium sp. 170]|uniref:ATP-binding protein n=1 Tax=Bradyrhizobium sp. 170 TaxID=2782641 RepID=UPI001FFEB729|nr:ATP-binding protein [Bradyrhizobium sp. 170]UPK05828.1 hypothetical protein IVB05_09810 [Bradyrhizobium sp. 170]